MLRTVIGLLLICSFLLRCSKQDENVSIIVNGEKITRQQIDQAMEMFRQSVVKTMPEKALETISPDMRATVARQLITNHLMIEDAKKRKLQVDSALVNKAYEKLKSGYADQSAFEQELTKMGENETTVKAELEKGAMLDTLLKVILEKTDTVTEEECKDYYLKNSSRYVSSPRFRASQIFFKADSASDKSNWEKRRKEAQQLCEKLKKEQKFEDAVTRYAKNPDVQAGDIGWFKKGDLKPELQRAIESKKAGEISDVVTTEIGFHILKKTDEEESKTASFEEVKDTIRKLLILRKKTDFISNYADSLISKAKITYLDTTLIPVTKD